MKLKLFLLPIMFASLVNKAFTQNIGIGTDSPQAKLHVNGNFKLKNGIAVNSISTDSTFDPGSDSTLPTQRAIKRFLQKGSWLGPDTSERKLIFQQRKEDLNMDGEMGLALQGHFAYAINPLENILSTYDISDPKNIIIKDSISTASLGSGRALAVSGNYAYVITTGPSARLGIFDISNPDNLVAKGFVNLTIQAFTIAVQGNYAYMASQDHLYIYDVSNPNNIVAKGSTNSNLASVSDSYVQGNYAYVTSGGNNRLCIYDISDPNNIVAKGFTTANLSFPSAVCVKGKYAYVLTTGNTRLCIFDISNPDNIAAKGFTSLSYPQAIDVQGNYAYVISGNTGVSVFDISDAANIKPKAFADTAMCYPNILKAQGNYVYVTSSCGFYITSFYYRTATTGAISVNDSGALSFLPPIWENEGADNVFKLSGNVGIGTDDPQDRLSIAGGISMDVGATNDGDLLNGIKMGGYFSGEGIASKRTPGGNANGLDFYTAGGNRLAITNAGNIGLGTTSPVNKLDVTGSAVIGSTYSAHNIAPPNGLLIEGNVGIGNTSPAQKLSVSGGITIDREALNSGTISNALIFGGDAATQAIASKKSIGANLNGLDFYTNSINRLAITNAGNIGVGVATPVNKLDVKGAAVIGNTYSGTNTAPTNGLLIEGNVGIGNTSPGQKLSVSGTITIDKNGANTGSLANGIIFGGDAETQGIASKKTSGGNQNGLDFYTGNSNRMVITNSGRIGIGTTSPSVALEVVGSVPYNTGTYRYLNLSGSGTFTSSNVDVSIRASSVIVATEFEANSDVRIKRNINTSSSQQDLSTLLKIRVADYQFQDSLYQGNRRIKGFIAQELETEMPQAVHTSGDYVPDIYSVSASTEYNETNKTLTISLCKPHQFKVGDKIKIFAGDGMQEQYVSAIANERTFTLGNWEIKEAGMNPTSKVFVWGKWVNDFHTVDYNQVFSLGISAIQQLAKENDELKKETEILKNKTESLQQQIDDLKKLVLKSK